VSAVVPNMEQHSHLIYFDWPWTAIVSLQSYNFTYIRLLAKYLRLSSCDRLYLNEYELPHVCHNTDNYCCKQTQHTHFIIT